MRGEAMKDLPVRWLATHDLSEVIDIERLTSSELARWSEADFTKELRTKNTIGLVCEYMGHTVGFIIYTCYLKKFEILHLAIHPDIDYDLVGASILNKMKSKLFAAGRNMITFGVRESNLRLQQLLRSHKFSCFKVLRENFTDTKEDAFLFQFRIPGGVKEHVDAMEIEAD